VLHVSFLAVVFRVSRFGARVSGVGVRGSGAGVRGSGFGLRGVGAPLAARVDDERGDDESRDED